MARAKAVEKVEEVAVKKRVRRTPEQRLAALEQKQAEILERQKAAIAKIEEAKKRLMESPAHRRERAQKERQFMRAAYALAPSWDVPHYIAAIEKALEEDEAALQARGEELLQTHGKGRRGRKPRMAR